MTRCFLGATKVDIEPIGPKGFFIKFILQNGFEISRPKKIPTSSLILPGRYRPLTTLPSGSGELVTTKLGEKLAPVPLDLANYSAISLQLLA